MFESKYSMYMTNNSTRFAEEDEIIAGLVPIDMGTGVPLYEKDGIILVDNMDNHSVTIGPTGCGKSRAVCKSLINSIIVNKESAVINDPKGELYRTTAAAAVDNGYSVRVLNFRNPKCSHRWNPLQLIRSYYVKGDINKAQQAAEDFATSIMSVTANKDDRYWDKVSATYFCGLILLCLSLSVNIENFTLENILPLCHENAEETIKRIVEYTENLSESLLSALKSVLEITSDKTKSCLYSVIHSGIDTLVKSEDILDLFSSNDIELSDIGYKPTLIYVIYPDEKACMNNVINAFLTQAYIALIDTCTESDDDRLPVRVNFVLDEFSNLAPIESFDNRISEARSKNMRFHLFIQSVNQLSVKYTERVAKTILSNCTSWICFSSKEIEFLDTLSKLCGTVVDYTGREKSLLSSSEIQYLKKGVDGVETLILRQGIRPYVAKLPYYDYTTLSSDKQLSCRELKRDIHVRKNKMSPMDWYKLAQEKTE